MKVLVIDIGGTNVKFLATGQEVPRKFPSGQHLTPLEMVHKVREAAADWEYEAVSIGYPGPILCGQPMTEPVNLSPGWMGFDFAAAFHRPVKVINDAAMQALGSYHGGKMLFVGLGTGFGCTVIMDGVIEPLELGRFRYKKSTLEHYVGKRGRERLGNKRWQKHVEEVVERLIAVLKPDDVVIGGGNAKKLKVQPPGTRLGDNVYAFAGGFRLWDGEVKRPADFTWSLNNAAQPPVRGPAADGEAGR
jgi:polyphosphate glucokinase